MGFSERIIALTGKAYQSRFFSSAQLDNRRFDAVVCRRSYHDKSFIKIEETVMETSSPSSETTRTSPGTAGYLLMAIAFFGIFVYGLLTALPGTVIPDLERNKFLPNDAVV